MRATHNKPTLPCGHPCSRLIQYEICQRRRTGRGQCDRGRPSRQAPLAVGERATSSKCCRIIGVRLPQFERHTLPKSAVRMSCLRAHCRYQALCQQAQRVPCNSRIYSLGLPFFAVGEPPFRGRTRHHAIAQNHARHPGECEHLSPESQSPSARIPPAAAQNERSSGLARPRQTCQSKPLARTRALQPMLTIMLIYSAANLRMSA